jgi:hypothetical protein
MTFGFHGVYKFILLIDLALACFVAGVGLVDHVDAPFATDDLAVGMTLLGGLDGGDDFHKKGPKHRSAAPLSNELFRDFRSWNSL